ncbi:MAG: Spy/CpxP family protein refolding chaperone [Gammaproteobacteria bacterium]|nr:Spy/CpxP family protein refolding chaperone [Gammaproteobacteria bacterium]
MIKRQILLIILGLGISSSAAYSAENCDISAHQELLNLPNPSVLSRISELDLNPSQKTKFRLMKKNYTKSERLLNRQFIATNTKLNQLIKTPKIDESQMSQLLFELNSNMVASQTEMTLLRHQLYTILKDAQKAKYKALQEEEHQYFRLWAQCQDQLLKKPNKPNYDPLAHLDKLKLNPAQKAKINPLIKELQQKDQQTFLDFDGSALSTNEMEKQLVQTTDAIDLNKLQEFVTQQEKLLVEVQKRIVITYHKIYQLLDEKQKIQFMTL